MELPVDIPQVFIGDVGIELGRDYILVSEQFLDHPQVGSPVKQVRGERVPECMGTGVGRYTGFDYIPFNGPIDSSCGQAVVLRLFIFIADEQGFFIVFPRLEVFFQPFDGAL